MKIPSGALTFIILAVIAIVSVLAFRAFAQGSGKPSPTDDGKKFTFTLTIGKSADEFAEFKKDEKDAKDRFDAALTALGDGNYQIRYKDDTGIVHDHYHPGKVSLKTDKVTTSELAKNEPPGDPHVTQLVKSDSPAQIRDVLNALK